MNISWDCMVYIYIPQDYTFISETVYVCMHKYDWEKISINFFLHLFERINIAFLVFCLIYCGFQ